MSNEAWAIVTAIAVLGIPSLYVWWARRGKIRVCADELREVFCEHLTPAEYADHVEEQRRIESHYREHRCANRVESRCV